MLFGLTFPSICMAKSNEAVLPQQSSRFAYLIYPASSISMKPTILPSERLVVDNSYFAIHQVKRGDLVVVRLPDYPNVLQVKRIVGIGGDVIEIRNGKLFQNGKPEIPLNYSITEFTSIEQNPEGQKLYNSPKVKINENQIYVLGDYRPAALDSRIWGPISTSLITGKPIYIYWSPDLKRNKKQLK